MANLAHYIEEIPIRPLLETRGRVYRLAETDPSFEQSAFYREFLEPYGVRWAATVPVELGEDGLAFLGLLRRREHGRYADADQDRLDKVSQALSALDRRHNPLAGLPPAAFREATLATLLLHRDGRIVAQTQEARNVLFMARHEHLGPPEWTRPDLHALPPEAAAAAEALFSGETAGLAREIQLRLAWGAFDFLLEKVMLSNDAPEPVVNVSIRRHEPLDITVARALWGWPLSPQEKRIVIASARNPSLAQLAETLGLTVGTLKHYINAIQSRLGASSRHELIEYILETSLHR